MMNYFSKHAAMGLPGLAAYPDVFAAGLIMLLAGTVLGFVFTTSFFITASYTFISCHLLSTQQI